MSDADRRISISDAADVILAERRAKVAAGETKLADRAVEEIAIVVRELASNIVKHAGDGSITVVPRNGDGRTGIEIRAEDFGPGIADVDRAVTDGYSTAGGLGFGLGAVHRLMDEVVIESNGNGGTGLRIVASRWESETSRPVVQSPIGAGAATRAKPGMKHNGDAFIIRNEGENMLVGVIDGLGHGRAAHEAAQQARQHVQTHANRSISRLFRGVEQACRSTRGVVMALARFDLAAEEVTLGSVGNITVKVHDSPKPMTVVPRRGVLGARAPSPMISEREWERNAALVMHSDGVAPDWSRDDFAHLEDASATSAARELLASFAEEHDDATVLVVKEVET